MNTLPIMRLVEPQPDAPKPHGWQIMWKAYADGQKIASFVDITDEEASSPAKLLQAVNRTTEAAEESLSKVWTGIPAAYRQGNMQEMRRCGLNDADITQNFDRYMES